MRTTNTSLRKNGSLFVCAALALLFAPIAANAEFLNWTQFADLPPAGDQVDSLGVAGPFVGVHNDALVIAGGANFPKPYWGEGKVWHNNIWVLDASGNWHDGGALPQAIGYGCSVSTELGVICIGGNDANRVFDDVFLLAWDPSSKTVTRESLPRFPSTIVYGAAAMIGQKLYVAGGTQTNDLSSALDTFWVLDLAKNGSDAFGWEALPSWPGPNRGFNLLAAQNNGAEDQLFLFSGRRVGVDGEIQFLKDAFAYSPSTNSWKALADAPACLMAGTAIPHGSNHLLVTGGADGSLFHQADALKDDHPGFPKTIWGYNALTDAWQEAGSMPQNHVTTQIARWGSDYIVATGEIRPRVRSPKIWKVSPQPIASSFGALNWITLIAYLGGLVVVGLICARNTRSADDFYLGGRSIPWWAAGISIFGTTLSAITYLALPARVYATDWSAILLNAGIIIVAPFIAAVYVPRLRRLNVTTAYQFLEARFDLGLRLFGSASFIVFQLLRMGIVVFLPALALSAVTGFNLTLCIVLMGLISTVYTAFGGIKAVIWTDVIQVVVLVGGALLALGIVVGSLGGGFSTLISVGQDSGKFTLPPIEWSWASDSFMTLMLAAIFANALVPYTSDQAVVQRYLTTATEGEARKAVWTNALLAIPATLIFSLMGIALFVFYKSNPELLAPLEKNDQILPWFVAHQMPAGLAGLVIAGVFAAAMSSLDSSMHSICTAVSNDFIGRFKDQWEDASQLSFARKLVAGLGVLGTIIAFGLSKMDTGHLFDLLIGLLGLIASPLAGLFLLGLFTKRASATSAWIGVSCSLAALVYTKYLTQLSGLLYGFVGIGVCLGVGYLASYIVPQKASVSTGADPSN